MDLSVVIPTFNRARLLRETIPALAGQHAPGCSYEVIFVSNGSADETVSVLQQAVDTYPDRFRYFHIQPTGGPSAPRNVGIRAARGAAVLIIDDDVLPEPELVLRHAEFHRDHPEAHHAALGEVYVPPRLLDDPFSLFHAFPYHEVRGLDRLGYLYFWTCNVSVKRAFMLGAGMFDERFLYYEDVICGHRLARSGMHLHFLPGARGQHLHQMQPGDVPTKGRFLGRWLYAFAQHVPERAVIERFGILSPRLGPRLFALRMLRRAAFRSVDNPLTHLGLRALGARSGRRSRWSDLYYHLTLRRHILAGYAEAKREGFTAAAPPTAGG